MIKNLNAIQNELKAPKSNYNSFGKYNYRSAEDILTAVKPLLAKYDCQLTISDDVIAVGNRVYIKATATITDPDGNSETVSAFAREEETKKGMDGSQITGTASSYARKYCLNGLFLIDDTKDADTDAYKLQTDGRTGRKKQEPAEPAEDETPVFNAEFMQNHGRDKISQREIDRLKSACEENERNGGTMTLKSALAHCNRQSVNDVTYTQYIALMACLKAAA